MAFAQVHDVNQIPEEWHQVAVKFRKTNELEMAIKLSGCGD